MLELKNFNLEALNAEMKKTKSKKTLLPKSIEAVYNKLNRPREVAEKHRQNDKLRFMYSSKETTPVKVGEITINYKIYKRLIAKLKGFEISIEVQNNALVVQYEKIDSKVKGRAFLDDISHYFEDFKHVPVAEFRNGQQT